MLTSQSCKATTERTEISRAEYIDTYVEILRAASGAADSAQASERAREILRQRGLSEDDLLLFAEQHAEDPAYLADVWMEIERKLRQTERPDSRDGR